MDPPELPGLSRGVALLLGNGESRHLKHGEADRIVRAARIASYRRSVDVTVDATHATSTVSAAGLDVALWFEAEWMAFASGRMWQVRASVSLGLVVAIPAIAAESSTPGRVDFTVSGGRPVTYSVVVTAAPAASTPSRSLDHVKPPEGAVSSSTSIEHDGLAGKEWRSTNGNRHARTRAFATESRLFTGPWSSRTPKSSWTTLTRDGFWSRCGFSEAKCTPVSADQ
jgi:hypothetical protein